VERLKGSTVKVVYTDGDVNKVKRGVLEHYDEDFVYILEDGQAVPVAINKKVVVSVDPSDGGH